VFSLFLKKVVCMAPPYVRSMLGWLSTGLSSTQRERGKRQELGCIFGGQPTNVVVLDLVFILKAWTTITNLGRWLRIGSLKDWFEYLIVLSSNWRQKET
jgi:hypothetical protein